MVSLHLQANTTNSYKLSILSGPDCHLHQTAEVCRSFEGYIPYFTDYIDPDFTVVGQAQNMQMFVDVTFRHSRVYEVCID